MVLLCFPSLFQFFFWLRVNCKVRTPYGHSGSWSSRAGFHSGSGESRGDVFSRQVAEGRHADSGVSARDLVTELREAHGSVRVAETESCQGGSAVGLYRCRKTRRACGSRKRFWRNIRSRSRFCSTRTVRDEGIWTLSCHRFRRFRHRAPGDAGDRSATGLCATSIAATTSTIGHRWMRCSRLCGRLGVEGAAGEDSPAGQLGGSRRETCATNSGGRMKKVFPLMLVMLLAALAWGKLHCPRARPSR